MSNETDETSYKSFLKSWRLTLKLDSDHTCHQLQVMDRMVAAVPDGLFDDVPTDFHPDLHVLVSFALFLVWLDLPQPGGLGWRSSWLLLQLLWRSNYLEEANGIS